MSITHYHGLNNSCTLHKGVKKILGCGVDGGDHIAASKVVSIHCRPESTPCIDAGE